MKRVIFFVLCLMSFVLMNAAQYTYTADDKTVFANPERGFIDQLEKVVSESKPNVVKGNESYFTQSGERETQRLVLVLYYLNNFKSKTTLPDAILRGFDEDMQVLRQYGYKCILRFAYTSSSSSGDAPLATVESHVAQLKPYWQKNADVIYVLQAGFVGAWGEWYYTTNFTNETGGMTPERAQLLQTLLGAMPKDRYIQLRTPAHKIGFVGDETALTSAEAFTGSDRARLAHHNDAFLDNYGDLGTYDIKRNGKTVTDTTLKNYIAKETLYVPIGGESCILDDAVAVANASYEKTTAEMSRLHWTFCKAGYSKVVTDKWRANGTYEELDRKMGYRLQLVSATLPDKAAAGGKANIVIDIRNTGYAPIYNYRPVYIVFSNGSKNYPVKLTADARRWLPNGAISTISEQITLPENIPAGTYQLYLHLPDAYASIADNPRYAVRFANVDIWDAATGMNSLNASVVVSSDAPVDPGTLPEVVSLPGTVNKNNVRNYSDDMTWYETDYFDFGPTDGKNTDRWAEWTVSVVYPGKYVVTETMATANGTGHSWQLELLSMDGKVVAEYKTADTWSEGEIEYDETWDLTSVAAGNYILRVKNVMEWGQPKLKSITLDYDGEVPSALQYIKEADDNVLMYDILGRRVNTGYRGIVIQNGRKRIIL